MILLILQLFILIAAIEASHYKGGLIRWRPVDEYTNASTVSLLITESHTWTLSRFPCNQALINSLGLYVDTAINSAPPSIRCQTSVTSCTGTGYKTINDTNYCTDFSTTVQTSSGSYIAVRNLTRTTNIVVGYTGEAWADEIIDSSSSTASAKQWSVVARIKLGTTYPINSSPVTGSLPIIRVIENTTAVIQIPIADWNRNDDLRCRWASATGTAGDECGDICKNLPNANLSSSECTLTWYVVRRPYDIARSLTTSTYVVAIMVEDFASTASTTALSSVPLQMLIFTYQPVSGACGTKPEITGDRPNRACVGVLPGTLYTERIVATVYCSGDYIVEFITISPLYMQKSTLAQVSGTTNQWYITLTWTPTTDQIGPQVFCVAPVDQKELTGNQLCISYVVGYLAPDLITPVLVQGSASPLGTVFSNQSLFSIQATSSVYRPSRNGTYIQIYNKDNSTTPVWQIDCGYNPDCVYTGNTVIFYVQNANWTPGAFYYILFTSGAASGNIFCSPESAPITDPNYWVFNIWDPHLSSTMTTTTTTTPPTTITVTTRGISTTTPNPTLTTTGIVITTSSIVATTTTTTISTVTTSLTTIIGGANVTSGTSTPAVTDVHIFGPKDFEEYCKQPVALINTVLVLVCCALQILGFFAYFIKLDKIFNPTRKATRLRHKNRIRKLG